MNKYILSICILLFSTSSMAGVYIEFGLEAGGDTMTPSSSSTKISAGSGLKIAVGMRHFFGEKRDSSLSWALGKIIISEGGCDSLCFGPADEEADFDTTTFEAIYRYGVSDPTKFLGLPGRFWVGGGLSYHLSPTYSAENLTGFADAEIEYDNSLGYLIELSFGIDFAQLGIRHTTRDYKSNNSAIDASSSSLFMNISF